MSRPPHSTPEAGWADFLARYGVGDVVHGEVVSVVPYGVFVRVDHDTDGVDSFAPKTLWPALPELTSQVTARIEAIDAENRRFALGPA